MIRKNDKFCESIIAVMCLKHFSKLAFLQLNCAIEATFSRKFVHFSAVAAAATIVGLQF